MDVDGLGWVEIGEIQFDSSSRVGEGADGGVVGLEFLATLKHVAPALHGRNKQQIEEADGYQASGVGEHYQHPQADDP